MRFERLVMDVRGAVVSDPMDQLFDALAAASGTKSRNAIRDHFNTKLSDDLWAGRLDESAFWSNILEFCEISGEPTPFRHVIMFGMTPNESAAFLPDWHRMMSLWAVGNHRTEWLRSHLSTTAHMAHYFDEIVLSCEVGLVAPDPEFYRLLISPAYQDPKKTLLLTADPKGLAAAKKLGFSTQLVQPGSFWVQKVNKVLGVHAST